MSVEQFVADTILLERFFQVVAEFNEEESNSLKKYAFDLGSILSGIGDSIHSFVGNQVHGKDSGGAARTVVDLLAPAIFFRLHPILGIIVTVAQLFGFDLYTVYQKIHDKIMPSIAAGKPVEAQDINNIAKSAIPNVQDDEAPALGTQASDDLLYPLRELESGGRLTKEALFGGAGKAWSAQPFVPKDSNPLIRAFSFLGRKKGTSLITGILVWVLKSVLLSAGLLVAGGAVVSALGAGKSQQAGSAQPTQQQAAQPQQVQFNSPSPTGAGSYVYKKSPQDMWVVDLRGKQPHEVILQWAIDSYPALYQYKNIILNTPSFWNAVRGVTEEWRPGTDELVVPDPYKKKDDVLALFVNDVFRNLHDGTT